MAIARGAERHELHGAKYSRQDKVTAVTQQHLQSQHAASLSQEDDLVIALLLCSESMLLSAAFRDCARAGFRSRLDVGLSAFMFQVSGSCSLHRLHALASVGGEPVPH